MTPAFTTRFRRLEPVANLLRRFEVLQYLEWIRQGRPSPPPHVVKRFVIREYARRFGADALVETGTYLGDMIHAQLPYFTRLVSIELSEPLYRYSLHRLEKQSKVTLLRGDSASVLPSVVEGLSGCAIYWLDGHYSAGITACGATHSPIQRELAAVFSRDPMGDVVLIDDARHFTGQNGYPTISNLRDWVETNADGYTFELQDDIIRIAPARQGA